MTQLFQRLFHPRKTPRMIQMEIVECGAAALGMILGYFGKHLPLQELRATCGVTRDGLTMEDMKKAALYYGLEAEVYDADFADLYDVKLPVILYWEYNHFIVLEEFKGNKALVNDPAIGHLTISVEELEKKYSGMILECSPGPSFTPSGKRKTLFSRTFEKVSAFKHSLTFLFLIQLGIALVGLATPVFAQVFIDHFFAPTLPLWEWEFLGLIFGVMLFTGGITWLQLYYLNFLEVRLSISLSTKFINKLLRLPILFFSQRYSSEIVNRMNLNTQIGQILTRDVVLNSINLLLLSSYWVLMFFYSVSITLLAAAVAIFNILLVYTIGRRRSNSYAKLQQSDAQAIGISFNALEHIESMKGSGNENFFFSQIAGAYTKSINNTQEIGKQDVWLSTLSSMSSQISTIFILIFGSWMVIRGALSIGELIALQILFNLFLNPVKQMAAFSTEVQSVEVDLTRLDDVLEANSDPFLEEREEGVIDTKLSGGLVFEDVSFGYKKLEEPLINHFNLTIKPASMIGLTGPNGSGKSTLLRLASSLFHPDEGKILYDEKTSAQYTQETITRSMAIIDQIVHFFPGTLRQNFSLWNSDVSDEEIHHALELALLTKDIAKLPLGIGSILEEDGKNFSSGQLQRLEIARVILKRPSILILDEATNALDAEAEEEILKNIRELGITTFIISHRLSSFKQCDRILVFDQGKIIQDGSHDTLKQAEGPYKKLLEFEIVEKT